MSKKLRIAIIESPNPVDLFEDRSEASALAASCKLIGHQTINFSVRSLREFKDTVNYLASSHSAHATGLMSAPLFLHISAHGDSNCLAIGTDNVSWADLADAILPLALNEGYNGPLALCLSSCGSGNNSVSRLMQKKFSDNEAARLPSYIFSIAGEFIAWDLALVAWNLFYFKLSNIGIIDKNKVINALKEIYLGTGVAFIYSRRDDETGQYRKWSADANK